jgi:hypothetical protein
MSTVQQLLDDINLRYRNTFTTDQKVFWMNQVQRHIYQVVRHESEPFLFTTVADIAFYPLPDDCDIKGIEQITIQIDNDTDIKKQDYEQLEYRRKDEPASVGDRFYSLVGRDIFLYPIPTTDTAGRNVYIYYAKTPKELLSTNLTAEPDLDKNFQELLVLGTLERICAARKDVQMKNNYASDFMVLLDDYEFMYKMTDPEFLQPIDVLPRRGRYGTVARVAR